MPGKRRKDNLRNLCEYYSIASDGSGASTNAFYMSFTQSLRCSCTAMKKDSLALTTRSRYRCHLQKKSLKNCLNLRQS